MVLRTDNCDVADEYADNDEDDDNRMTDTMGEFTLIN